MVSPVNKYKISLVPAKHISNRVVKLLHQTEEACERNIENKNSAFENQKQWSHGQPELSSHGQLQVFARQEQPIRQQLQLLHGKSNQSNQIKSQLQVFARHHPCNYGLLAFVATNQIKVVLHSM